MAIFSYRSFHMRDVSSQNFGLLIAYLLPGFTVLWGISHVSPTIQSWIGTTTTDGWRFLICHTCFGRCWTDRKHFTMVPYRHDSVNDPCVGSGRMLLAAAELQPHRHFVGQDVDLRCVRMTSINLALRNYYGHVVHGNSLSNTASLIYETGRVLVWGNAIRKTNHVPLPDREPQDLDVPLVEVLAEEGSVKGDTSISEHPVKRSQLRLF